MRAQGVNDPRITWQNDAFDMEMRSKMMREIKRMLMKRQEDGMTLFDRMPSRIQRISPLIIQHIESLLYLNARSRDEYSNKKTLKKRLQRIRNGLTSSSETVGGSGSTSSGNNVETE